MLLPIDRARKKMTKVACASPEDEPAAAAPSAVAHHSQAEQAFLELCRSNPKMARAAEEAAEGALTAEEREARAASRRAKMKAQAEAAMARFETLTEEEKADERNQGELEHYSPEALALREQLRDDERVCRLLEKWWKAASMFLDRDKNAALDAAEYETFYIRLLRLVDDDEDDAEDEAALDTADEKAQFEADFRSDAGDDGMVTKDEFMSSIFQLADQWTGSTEAAEYIEFLSSSYATVFSDLAAEDELQFPDAWAGLTKSKKALAALGPDAACELALECYRAKIVADNTAATKGVEPPPLATVSLDYIKSKFGASDKKRLKPKVAAFAKALHKCNTPDGKDHSDFLWLFSRLVGCYTASGRVRAVPGAGASFVTNCLEEIGALVAETNPKLPNNVKTPEERGMKAGKNSALVGHIGLVAAEKWLERKAFPALGLAPGGALDNEPLRACVVDVLRRSALSYEAVVGEAGGDLTVAKLTTCAELLVLVANLWVATQSRTDEHVAQAAKAEAARA